jgi:hypothetical protein
MVPGKAGMAIHPSVLTSRGGQALPLFAAIARNR